MNAQPAMENRLDTIEGTVVTTRWRNQETGWTILVAVVGNVEVGVLGELEAPAEKGCNFDARGRWEDNPKHGRQFRADALSIKVPTTIDQIVARLETYPGIGPTMAAKIVEQFGEQTWQVLDERIDSLSYIPGMGKAGLAKVRAHHALQNSPVAKIKNRLLELGAPASVAKAIHKEFGPRALEVLEHHPYQVAARVPRFGFKLAEKVARATGIDLEGEDRVEAGIIYALQDSQLGGHCAMPIDELGDAAARELGLRREVVDLGLERLTGSGSLREHHGLLLMRHMDRVEDQVARALAMLATPARVVWDASDLPERLSDGQCAAVEAVARAGVTVITGGPGTGKSTVLSTVLEMAEREGTDVILCAPTGRAAKRMAEATGRPASTIHRLLKAVAGSGEFHHDEQDPLPPGLLVVDELSMVDIRLADALLRALTKEHRVLLVGDVDQLPSVGPGNVLRDILDAAEGGASRIAVVRLRHVFRQAAGSTIISNAHRILEGSDLKPDPPGRGAAGEFYIANARSPEEAHKKIVDLASHRIPFGYNLDRMSEIQVLCPTHAGPAGTEALNAALQRCYTARGREGFWGARGVRYCVGDRVMQLRNDYKRNVFNGDIGLVVDIDQSLSSPVMTVDFDGVTTTYKRFELSMLRLAYAMTIHKSQGSEFPAVIVPVLNSHRRLSMNLLYTAITRAKRLCMIVGPREAIRRAVQTGGAMERWTGLKHRILESLD